MPTVLDQIDKNHLIKTFDRLFKKFNTKNSLKGLKGHLQAWLYTVVQMNLTESEKIERWMGAFDHYTSNITVL